MSLFENPLPEKIQLLTMIRAMTPKEHRMALASLLDALHECQRTNSMLPVEKALWRLIKEDG